MTAEEYFFSRNWLNTKISICHNWPDTQFESHLENNLCQHSSGKDTYERESLPPAFKWMVAVFSGTAALTHYVLNADGIPALHDGQEGDEGGDEPATAQHGRHSHRGHLVSIDQRLAANSIVPEITRPHWIRPAKSD